MKSLWNDADAKKYANDPVALRAYTSRLLGQEPSLVQHGGGNTSVKASRTNLFGEPEELLYVKGSGWDLATIEPQGFAPVKMEILLRMAQLEHLSDTDMVREQKAAMTNPSAPNPSVEAIMHAIIPFKFVEHTHSDAVVTLTNTPKGKEFAREVFGPNALLVDYVMPGFVLARRIYELTRDADWTKLETIVLLNHGIFTFHDDAKIAYEKMIELVTKAEKFLISKGAEGALKSKPDSTPTSLEMATLRNALGKQMGKPLLLRLNNSEEAVGFSKWEIANAVTDKGTVTPDHVIHVKPRPLFVNGDFEKDVMAFSDDYKKYFDRHKKEGHSILDTCPRWVVWPGKGCLSIATTAKGVRIIDDIITHTRRCLQWGEKLGGWKPVSEADLFDVEYWELEQAKLKVGGGSKPMLQGQVAVVTGGASGIGKAIAEALKAQGAAVAVLDMNPEVEALFKGDQTLGVTCNVTDEKSIADAIHKTALKFGGVDILITNAGTFPPGKKIEEISEKEWTTAVDINLSGHWRTLKAAIPLLKQGFSPSVIIVGSKNVPAPGPGASAYSTSKAGLTQLGRVAALELAPYGVRVNTIHPDAVFDTGIWSEEVIANRAKHYGLTVEQYKTKNLLKAEITSKNVADLVLSMVGPAFARTTGAQIPIDGGNDRVI